MLKEMFNLLFKKPQRFLRHFWARMAFLLCVYIDGWAPMPFVIFITINNRCNMRCKTCDVGQKQTASVLYKEMIRDGQLGPDAWKAFIDEVAHYRPTLDIGTTEPLLYDGIIEVLEHIKRRRLSCCLTTNGWRLPELAEAIARTDIHKLMVSIDGPPEAHDRIRGVKDAFKNAICGIQKLKGFNDRIKIGINYTISNYNYGLLEETLELLEKEFRWDSFLFAHLSFVTDEMAQSHNKLYKGHAASHINMSGVKLADVDTGVLCKQIANIKERYKNRDIKFYPDIPSALVETYYRNPSVFVMPPRCVLPWISVNAASNGDIIVLNRCQMPSLGNLCKTPFKKIWNNRFYRDFRLRLKKAGAFPICGRCEGVAIK